MLFRVTYRDGTQVDLEAGSELAARMEAATAGRRAVEGWPMDTHHLRVTRYRRQTVCTVTQLHGSRVPEDPVECEGQEPWQLRVEATAQAEWDAAHPHDLARLADDGNPHHD